MYAINKAILIGVAAVLLIGIFMIFILPGSLKSSIGSANETAAIVYLHRIAGAQAQYKIYNREYGTFDQLAEAGLLDSRFTGEAPTVDGYTFTMKIAPKGAAGQAPGYSVNADPRPAAAGMETGRRHFYIDSGNRAVRFNEGQPATASDKLVDDPG